MLNTIMLKRHLPKLLAGMLAGLSLWSTAADAITFDLKDRKNKPKITLRVGDNGVGINNVNLVTFTVPVNQLGNGTPIAGSEEIHIRVTIRATAANPLTGILTVDSLSDPLKNTASSTTIPFSEISWTASDGDIPSGVYQETVNQYIIDFQSSQGYRDDHTFSYANTMLIEAGTYTGSVKYTWAIP